MGERNSIRPGISNILSLVMDLPRKRVIFIERLDFLFSRNGQKKTINLINCLRDLAYIRDHIIILTLDPDTLSGQEIMIIEKETKEPMLLHSKLLPEDLSSILRFVYEENLMGKEPSQSEILAKMGITKPTARKRINELIFSAYIRETAMGNKKVLSVTEKGMTALNDKPRFPG
jgi:hypothetical protein